MININNDISPRRISLGLIWFDERESRDSTDKDSVSKLIRLRVNGMTPTLGLIDLIEA